MTVLQRIEKYFNKLFLIFDKWFELKFQEKCKKLRSPYRITLEKIKVFRQLNPLEKSSKFAMFMEKENPCSFFIFHLEQL